MVKGIGVICSKCRERFTMEVTEELEVLKYFNCPKCNKLSYYIKYKKYLMHVFSNNTEGLTADKLIAIRNLYIWK